MRVSDTPYPRAGARGNRRRRASGTRGRTHRREGRHHHGRVGRKGRKRTGLCHALRVGKGERGKSKAEATSECLATVDQRRQEPRRHESLRTYHAGKCTRDEHRRLCNTHRPAGGRAGARWSWERGTVSGIGRKRGGEHLDRSEGERLTGCERWPQWRRGACGRRERGGSASSQRAP